MAKKATTPKAPSKNQVAKEKALEAIRAYHGETSVSASETRDGLLDLANEAQSLADACAADMEE